jgi:hypothetical protein
MPNAAAFRLLVALLGGRDLLLYAKHLFSAARTVLQELQEVTSCLLTLVLAIALVRTQRLTSRGIVGGGNGAGLHSQ